MESRDKLRWLFVAWVFAWGYSTGLNQLFRVLDPLQLNVWLQSAIEIALACVLAHLVVRKALRTGVPAIVWQGTVVHALSATVGMIVFYFAFASFLVAAAEHDVAAPMPYPLSADPDYFLRYVLARGAVVLTAYLTATRSPDTEAASVTSPSRSQMALAWTGLAVWVAAMVGTVVAGQWFAGSGI